MNLQMEPEARLEVTVGKGFRVNGHDEFDLGLALKILMSRGQS